MSDLTSNDQYQPIVYGLQCGFVGGDNLLHTHDQYTGLKTMWSDLLDRMATISIT